MERGLYSVEGGYNFSGGHGGSQRGQIENLEHNHLAGYMNDIDRVGEYSKIVFGIYEKNEEGVYLLKAPLKNPRMIPVIWKFKQKEDVFFGSWIFLTDIRGLLFSRAFNENSKGEAIETAKKILAQGGLELIFSMKGLNEKLKDAEAKGQTGYLKFTMV